MARFRLKSPHYLKLKAPAEYEHKEVDQATGKQATKRYPVPTHLDPDNPADCNYPGEIIVTDKESRLHPKDLVFLGPPTPEMEPLDEEAERLVAQWEKKWVHPIDSLPATGTSQL